MSSSARWILVVGAVLVLVAAVAVLLQDDGAKTGGESAVLTRTTPEAPRPLPDRPRVAADASPRPIEVNAAEPAEVSGRRVAPAPDQTRRVEGVVVFAIDGSPVSGAEIAGSDQLLALQAQQLDQDSHDPKATPAVALEPMGRTDANGRFDLRVPTSNADLIFMVAGSGPYGVNERAARGGVTSPSETTWRNHPLSGAGDLSGLRVEFDTGWDVHGVVLDDAGVPVEGASIQLDGERIERTDRSGRFEIRWIQDAGGVELTASAPWYVPDTTDLGEPDVPRRVGPIKLQLEPGGALEGFVTTRGGLAVAGAHVRVRLVMTTRHGRSVVSAASATSDERGWYSIPGVPSGTLLVSARAEGMVDAWLPDVFVSAREVTRFDITLSAGATLAGRVSDSAGNTVPGAELVVQRLVRWAAPDLDGSMLSSRDELKIVSRLGDDGEHVSELTSVEQRATCDERGEYVISGLSPGDKRITASEGTARLSPAERDVTLGADERREAFDFILNAGLSLTGRVTDMAGDPIEDVSIVVKGQGEAQMWTTEGGARTDGDGRFVVAGLVDEPMTLWAHRQGYGDLWEQVRISATELRLVMQPSIELRGQVLIAGTGEPLNEFDLELRTESMTMGMGIEGTEGHFAVDLDEDKPYDVVVKAEGYAEQTLERVLPSSTLAAPLTIYVVPE